MHVYDFDFSANPSCQPVVDATITRGDTVHWVWDQGTHSTTSAAGQVELWNSGVHSPPFSFDHTFTNLGTFNYYCMINGVDLNGGQVGGMSGSVTVISTNPPAALAVDAYVGVGISGLAGKTYRIEYATRLAPSNWVTLTNIVLPSSHYLFFDPSGPIRSNRFYRAVSPP